MRHFLYIVDLFEGLQTIPGPGFGLGWQGPFPNAPG